ncbi:sodium:solute symporter family protein [Fictibacillus barbaricus]|uniref:Sodium:solute symporter n=1 Tax=Fictibacillus barbaricus TaxID=182136 RepID=A0ABS2Z892_9BACL|nr:sodium:solute symporter [Fictibacillus barbaricus]MBN3544342.1 sodium:solute symporter [Fictibacillus barbaricus]GGB67605.1 putative symporter YhjB [Fictibacillus barbaricus]
MNAALVIIFAVMIMSIYLGIRAKKGKDMDLEQWTVGGRGFGTIFVFLLMAGEIYTTFTFLGGSGWAYGKGGPTFYIIGYGCLAYIMSYFLLPKIWRYAKDNNLLSQSDFFVSKYKSPYLGIFVSLVGVVAMIPYFVLQLKGLGIIVSEASYGTISPTIAIWIGLTVVTVYVMVSGIHGSAWTAVAKDILILVVVLFLGIYLPIHYYGGIQPMFEAVEAAKPGFLALPETGMSPSWFATTILLTALGFYMWPHTFGSVYSAQNEKVFRKNAIFMPIYQLILLFVFFVGFAAILQVPGLEGPEADLALLRISIETFDPWVVGVIGAAGILTALVPGSMILMAAATLLAKNVYQVLNPKVTDQQVSKTARYLVPVVALIAVFFTFKGGNTLVTLLLMGYSLVTQLFPTLAFSLMKNNFVTKQGAFAGIAAGVATVAYVTITGSTVGSLLPFLPQAIQDFNVGIIAMILNIIVLTVVSLLTKPMSVTSRKTKTA